MGKIYIKIVDNDGQEIDEFEITPESGSKKITFDSVKGLFVGLLTFEILVIALKVLGIFTIGWGWILLLPFIVMLSFLCLMSFLGGLLIFTWNLIIDISNDELEVYSTKESK